jgi:predicted ATP-grasp superfamily ATP-dependent carboligase
MSDPIAAPDAFGAAVPAPVRVRSVDALIPATRASLRAILALREQLEVILRPFPNGATFARVSDDESLLAAIRGLKIAVPDQLVLQARDPEATGILGFPLVIKPCVGLVRHAGRSRKVGVVHVADRAELDDVLGWLPGAAFPVLVRQRISGSVVGLFLLRWNESTIARLVYRRIREKFACVCVNAYRESITVR